jgi:cytochrome c5
MRYFFAIYVLVIIAVVSIAGLRGSYTTKPPLEVFSDMDRQNKLRPQAANSFFATGRSSQIYVEGTIARGMPYQDIPINTGTLTGKTNFVSSIPVIINEALLERGRQRYDINCSPCHGDGGDGKGVVTKYGMVAVANFHDPRLVKMTAGEIFNTITHGKNLMGSYGANIDISDRWAIVAYLRALQRSRLAVLDEIPGNERAALQQN